MSGSIIAWGGDMRRLANTRRNWSLSHQTSSWHRRLHLRALQQATHTVPIVFALVTDPVGGGFVASLARPGGNVTGFTHSNTDLAENGWSYLNRSRRASRAWRSFAIPPIPAGIGQFGAIQAVAPSLGVELSPVDVRDAEEIERAVSGIRARAEWRHDRGGGHARDRSSRTDHHARGPA